MSKPKDKKMGNQKISFGKRKKGKAIKHKNKHSK